MFLESAAATTLRLTTSRRRSRYFAGVSSSWRSGRVTDPRGSWKELFFEAQEPGVMGVNVPCRDGAMSWFCLNRPRPRRSPKLLRPVEMDVLEVGGAKWSSTESRGEFLPRELKVEDLPRL